MKGALTAGRLRQGDVMNVTALLLEHGIVAHKDHLVDIEAAIPDVEARRAFMRAALLWDGTPDLFDAVSDYPYVRYDLIAGFLANLIRGAS